MVMKQTWMHMLFFFFFSFFSSSSNASDHLPAISAAQYSVIRTLHPVPSSNVSITDDEYLLSAAQPFPLSQNTTTPHPSSFWAPKLLKSPLPTNRAWLNYILNQGNTPEYIHPYLIQSNGGAISIGYPSRLVQPGFITQSFVPDITITSSALSASSKHVVTHYDDLSVTLQFEKELSVPLVRGCPYVTFLFKGDNSSVRISTIHAVLELLSDESLTKHKITFNNGQKWLIYSSYALNLSFDLSIDHDFKGFVRVALLAGDDSSEYILDKFKSSYPLHGYADLSVPFQIRYVWKRKGRGELLMLSLPMHRDMMSNLDGILQQLSYNSIDGEMLGIVGNSWVLNENPISVGWHSVEGISDSVSKKMVSDALNREVGELRSITTNSSYFYGKAVARAARMALVAEEIGSLEFIEPVQKYLEDSLTPWMEGTFEGNAFLYDKIWGGLITRNGAMDSGADFGFGLYNDHHYHLGYFCYAGAVLAKLNSSWGASYKPHLYTMVEDYMSFRPHHHHHHHHHHGNISEHESQTHDEILLSANKNTRQHRALFPRLRNLDLWVLHSWAGGLTEFADGRNQESTSEAVNAYYAASLLGRAFGDDDLIRIGLTLAAVEMRAARALWHIPSNSTLYEREFVVENRVVGVLWANKRDSGLWFAPAEWRECRFGIQVLPILPITEILFWDVGFIRELVDWASPALARPGAGDGWKGFVYAMQAAYAPQQALANMLTLSEYDDGQSLSNLLWWIFSRP